MILYKFGWRLASFWVILASFWVVLRAMVRPPSRLGSDAEPIWFGNRAHMVRTPSPHGSDAEPIYFGRRIVYCILRLALSGSISSNKLSYDHMLTNALYATYRPDPSTWFGNRAHTVRTPSPHGSDIEPTWFGHRAGLFYEPGFGNQAVLVRTPSRLVL